jgi:hypothetical protein
MAREWRATIMGAIESLVWITATLFFAVEYEIGPIGAWGVLVAIWAIMAFIIWRISRANSGR